MATEVKLAAPDEASVRFGQLVKQHELKPEVAEQLWRVLSKCEIVLLCDDSGMCAALVYLSECLDRQYEDRDSRSSNRKNHHALARAQAFGGRCH